MHASMTLRAEVSALADRFRSLPESRLRRAAPAGLALARELSAAAQRVERPDREPLVMPDEGIYATGDQLAVAGHDLAAALEEAAADEEAYQSALRAVAAVRAAL